MLIAVVVAGCGTTKNPNFCCLTEADCQAAGATEVSPCAEGLACKNHGCEPAACATEGCTASAPVCVTATDMCVGCADSADCARFSGVLVCDPDDGACVECANGSDCSSTEPICDARECRACRTDTECASGACADDGTCVAEANAVYMDPNGVEAAPCSKAAPCKGPKFGVEQLSAARPHLVFAPGSYSALIYLTIAAPIAGVWIHGHGASVSAGNSDGGTFIINVPTTIRDLSLTNPDNIEGYVLQVRAASIVERVKISGPSGVDTRAPLAARDIEIIAGTAGNLGVGIVNSGALTLDRARIHGGTTGIRSNGGTIDITNTMIYNTTQIGVDLQNTGGAIKFSTIAYTGLSTAEATTFGVRCGNTVAVRSSIVWTFFVVNAFAHVPVEQCSTIDGGSIIGPMAVGGASSSNPSFVNESTFDFHINGNSPAHDAFTQGPALDFEGDPRPQGVGFDVGADEAP